MQGCRRSPALQNLGENEGPEVGEKLCVVDGGRQKSLGGEGACLVLGAEENGERWYGIDEAAVLGLNG